MTNRPPRKRAALRVEALEDRRLLSCNTISGFVYHDANNNGLFDPGETPIANSSLELRNAQGVVVATARSDARGYYEFGIDQTVDTAPKALLVNKQFENTPTNWSKTQALPQFDPALGTLLKVDVISFDALISQTLVEGLDSRPGKITAAVSGTSTLTGPGVASLTTSLAASDSFDATAFDGYIDWGGTSGRNFGVKRTDGSNAVTLTDPKDLAAYTGKGTVAFTKTAQAASTASGTGNVLAQINTTAAANVVVIYTYVPDNCLKPGSYTIVQTTQPPGYLDGKESAAGKVLPNSAGVDRIPVVLNGADSINNNFGEVLAAGVAGCVVLEANGARSPLAGVTITLSGTDDMGQQVRMVQQTQADGSYSFNGLRPGNYSIKETQPAGYQQGTNRLGSLGGALGNDEFFVALGSGAAGREYCFVEAPTPPTAISAQVAQALPSKRLFLSSSSRSLAG